MNIADAQSAYAELLGLFPKWEPTEAIESLWMANLGACRHSLEQVVSAIRKHKNGTRYNDPVWGDDSETSGRSGTTIKGYLGQMVPDSVAKPRFGRNVPEEGSPEWIEQFDRKRAATLAWIERASDEELAELTERTAQRLERDGKHEYARIVRNPKSADARVPGNFVAAAFVATWAQQPTTRRQIVSGGVQQETHTAKP